MSCACWEFGPPLGPPPKILNLGPRNILNLPTPMGWMDDLRLYVLFISISVMSGRWAGVNDNVVCNEPRLRLKRSLPQAGVSNPEPLDQQACATGAITSDRLNKMNCMTVKILITGTDNSHQTVQTSHWSSQIWVYTVCISGSSFIKPFTTYFRLKKIVLTFWRKFKIINLTSYLAFSSQI